MNTIHEHLFQMSWTIEDIHEWFGKVHEQFMNVHELMNMCSQGLQSW